MSSKNKNAAPNAHNNLQFPECDDDELVDIGDVVINMDLDKEDRIKDFIRQIKNPYCYKCNGMTVKISFSGEKTMEECLKEIIF